MVFVFYPFFFWSSLLFVDMSTGLLNKVASTEDIHASQGPVWGDSGTDGRRPTAFRKKPGFVGTESKTWVSGLETRVLLSACERPMGLVGESQGKHCLHFFH